ncbi:MAG: hypothetical protein ACRECL_06925 [Bradyrhizobium sp.]
MRQAVDATMMIMASANMLDVAHMRMCPKDMMMFMTQSDVTTRISPGEMIMRMSQSEMMMRMSPGEMMMGSCRGGRRHDGDCRRTQGQRGKRPA